MRPLAYWRCAIRALSSKLSLAFTAGFVINTFLVSDLASVLAFSPRGGSRTQSELLRSSRNTIACLAVNPNANIEYAANLASPTSFFARRASVVAFSLSRNSCHQYFLPSLHCLVPKGCSVGGLLPVANASKPLETLLMDVVRCFSRPLGTALFSSPFWCSPSTSRRCKCMTAKWTTLPAKSSRRLRTVVLMRSQPTSSSISSQRD